MEQCVHRWDIGGQKVISYKMKKGYEMEVAKPKLLDLFCGATLQYNRSCAIIKIWLKLYVSIAGKHLHHKGEHANIVRYHALIILHGRESALGTVNNAVSHSLCDTLVMPTDNIVLRLVRKRLLLRRLKHGGSLTQRLMPLINRGIWQRILVYIAKEQEVNALKLSAYWGANV